MQEALNNILAQEIRRALSIGLELNKIAPECTMINARSVYGCCRIKNGVYRICISKPYVELAPLEEIRTVIAHEIAHAVKGGCGHKGEWQTAVKKLREAYDYAAADYHLTPNPYSKNRQDYPHTPLPRIKK